MNLFKSIGKIINRSNKDNVSAFASESALFIIMGFVPFLILLMTLIKFTPITQDMMVEFFSKLAPPPFEDSIEKLVSSIYSGTSIGVIAIVIVSILWTAGKGFDALIHALDTIFNVRKMQNAFLRRLIAILYTIVFVFVILICVVLYILGNKLLDLANTYAPVLGKILDVIVSLRAPVVMLVLFLFFSLLYIAIPRHGIKFRYMFPGALFSALGWIGFSFGFSIYVNYFPSANIIYGSLTTIVLLMIWLYVCMYIFLLGGEVNMYIYEKTMEIKELKEKVEAMEEKS